MICERGFIASIHISDPLAILLGMLLDQVNLDLIAGLRIQQDIDFRFAVQDVHTFLEKKLVICFC